MNVYNSTWCPEDSGVMTYMMVLQNYGQLISTAYIAIALFSTDIWSAIKIVKIPFIMVSMFGFIGVCLDTSTQVWPGCVGMCFFPSGILVNLYHNVFFPIINLSLDYLSLRLIYILNDSKKLQQKQSWKTMFVPILIVIAQGVVILISFLSTVGISMDPTVAFLIPSIMRVILSFVVGVSVYFMYHISENQNKKVDVYLLKYSSLKCSSCLFGIGQVLLNVDLKLSGILIHPAGLVVCMNGTPLYVIGFLLLVSGNVVNAHLLINCLSSETVVKRNISVLSSMSDNYKVGGKKSTESSKSVK